MRGAELSPPMLAAARPPRPRGVPAKRGWSHRSGRTDALPRPSPPPPPPPPAADGRDEGGSGVRRRGEAEVARGRRRRREGGGDGAEREEAAVAVKAAGRNNAVAVAAGYVASGAEGFAGLVVAREERESGGGGGGGELERRRGLEPAERPPPKRRAVSAKRQFPPGCGRDAAALIAGGDGGEDGLRLGASPSHGVGALEKAAAAPHARRGSSVEGGLLFEAAPANDGLGVFEKVAATDGGCSGVDQFAIDIVGALSKGFSDGPVEDQELEEGEVAPEAHHEVGESPEIAGFVVLDDSASGRHEALARSASDEMKCMKGLQHEGNDSAQAAQNDLLIGSRCRMSLPAAADKSSDGGPSNGIIQGKRMWGSNGMNGEPLGLAVGDSGSGTVKSKVRNMEKPSVLIQRNMVVNSSGSWECFGATGIAQVHRQATSNGVADGQELEKDVDTSRNFKQGGVYQDQDQS